MDVPCCRSLCVSFLVLNTNQWDANSIKDAIISFSILEDVADRVFSKLEKDIESVSTRLNGLRFQHVEDRFRLKLDPKPR